MTGVGQMLYKRFVFAGSRQNHGAATIPHFPIGGEINALFFSTPFFSYTSWIRNWSSLNPYNAVYKPWRPKYFFQFEIIINLFPVNFNTYAMGLRPL